MLYPIDAFLIEEVINGIDAVIQPHTFEAMSDFLKRLREELESREVKSDATAVAEGLYFLSIENPDDPHDNRMQVIVKDPNEKPEKEEETDSELVAELQARANFRQWAIENRKHPEYLSPSVKAALSKMKAFGTWKADMMEEAAEGVSWNFTNNLRAGDGLQFIVGKDGSPERVTVMAVGGEEGDFKLDHHDSAGSFCACYVGKDRFYSTLLEYLNKL